MLGILFIYFIGKYFYNLAIEYNKEKWLYGILGVVVYYAGGFLILAGLIIFAELLGISFVDSMNETALSLLAIPFGLASCYVFYYLLKRNWSKNFKVELDSIDEIGKPE